jgi:competence protein ComEC
MTLGATLLTAPLVAYRFHDVSLSGLLINLVAIPAAGVLLIAAFVAVLIAVAIPAFGPLLLRTVAVPAGLFLQGLHEAASWSRGSKLVLSLYPTEIEVLLAFVVIGAVAWLRYRPRPALALISLAAVVFFLVSFPWPKRDLEVVFLDVGQGDAALVLTPSGRSLLVDGGGFLIPGEKARKNRFDIGREVIVPYLKRRGLKRLDAVLLSHPHPDHFGGLQGVFESLPVGEFWWSGQTFPDASFDDLLTAVRANGATARTLKGGDSFTWNGINLEVLYPDRISGTRSINDNSLVVRLKAGDQSILFAGDIEKEGERSLADRVPIEAGILKIPHHASRTSSSVPFIDSVRPFAAVASLGENNLFGFPHAGILEKYERRGVWIYWTDRDGAVTVRLFPGLPRKPPSIRTFFSGE